MSGSQLRMCLEKLPDDLRAVLALRVHELLHAATVLRGVVGQVFLDRLTLAAVVLDPLLDRSSSMSLTIMT